MYGAQNIGLFTPRKFIGFTCINLQAIMASSGYTAPDAAVPAPWPMPAPAAEQSAAPAAEAVDAPPQETNPLTPANVHT